MRIRFRMTTLLFAAASAATAVRAAGLGYQDTPMLPPENKWHVHDGERPQPKVVKPGAGGAEAPSKPPSDAQVLFDGTNLAKWKAGDGKPTGWKLQSGYMEAHGGNISTRDEFGDCQLHVEWFAPTPPKNNGQGRGNSGVFMFGRYEIQVLDSYENPTYPDGQAAAIYGQCPPLVNACVKPGEWNVYDIVFIGPRFKDGKLVSPAYLTLFHNGVLVHNHRELIGDTGHKTVGKYNAHGPKGPLVLQDHGDPVRFRNIWIRELKGYDEQ